MKKTALALLLSSAAWQCGHATQYINNADKNQVEVTVSSSQQNVLAIEGRKIASVIPSVAGAIAYEKDEDQGVLYFSLADQYGTGTISVFVNDDQGTRYRLILVPKGVGAEEIIIRPPTTQSTAKGESSIERNEQSFVHQIKELVYVMGDESTSPQDDGNINGITRITINKKIPLWQNTDLYLLRRYEGDALYGELYQLTNHSTKDMVIYEQDFYRKGVVAISIENLNLAPEASTYVYIIRERK